MYRFFFIVWLLFPCVALHAAESVTMIDATEATLKKLIPQSSKLNLSDGKIRVETDSKGQWPGFRIEKQDWNLGHCNHIIVTVTNHDKEPMSLNCRLDSPEYDTSTMTGTYTSSISVPAGETVRGRVNLPATIPPQLREKLFGMRGFPGGARGQGNVGSAKPFRKNAVINMTLFLNKPGRETRWSIEKVEAVASANTQQAEWSQWGPEKFFPMIDTFGQFKHEDWPGKLHSEADFKKTIEAENADFEKFPGPKNWSKYGGNANGPKREATGHFRVEKVDGRWWYVDPEGYLFWSHGTDCVIHGNGVTPISDREFYYEGLPARDDSKFKSCYGKGWWAPHNYYEDKTPFDTFNFTQYNLMRKFGDDWKNIHAERVHKRLKSWGMNTIANWSSPEIYGMRKTVYTAQFSTGGRRIEGSSGYWGKFPDPFSKEFEDNTRKGAENEIKRGSVNDPWCLGYFVDNEISWGGERSLALGAITSPTDQPAKLVFVEDLKKKYGDIGKLNDAWGTKHADWNALLASTEKPDENKAKTDLDAFHKKVCKKYFETIRDAVKKVAPNKLYFGCRFAWVNETAIYAAAEYCDVISFNKYARNLTSFKLPEGIDLPVVIGEFHFGALDRGMFHTGLVPTDSQEKRAEAYETYVRSALEHPNIIGTHWFQYGDQATTGRGDGENYQIGLLNIVDTPYPETIDAVRRVGYELYKIRNGK